MKVASLILAFGLTKAIQLHDSVEVPSCSMMQEEFDDTMLLQTAHEPKSAYDQDKGTPCCECNPNNTNVIVGRKSTATPLAQTAKSEEWRQRTEPEQYCCKCSAGQIPIKFEFGRPAYPQPQSSWDAMSDSIRSVPVGNHGSAY